VTRRFSPRRSTRPRPSHRRQALHRLVLVGDDAAAHRDNGTPIFTRDGDGARAFANNVKIGMVGINVPIPVPVAYHSFGGWKASIFGDPGIYGMEGVRFRGPQNGFPTFPPFPPCPRICRGIGRAGHGGGFRNFRKRYANLEAQRGPAAARIL
jgi:hypothetical protein